MKKLVTLALLGVVALLAQPEITKVLEVKHLTGDELTRTHNILKAFGAHVVSDPVLRVFAVSGTKGTVEAVENYLKRVDVPPAPKPLPKNFELTVYLMEASRQASAGATPPALESVVRQLRSVFTYQGYQLVDTIVLRAREGEESHTSGVLPASPPKEGRAPRIYTVHFRRISAAPDAKGATIRLDDFRFNVRIPAYASADGKLNYIDVGVSTDVDIREGQKVVVGKAKVDESDASLFLVVMARTVE
jgi:hypothetical protein